MRGCARIARSVVLVGVLAAFAFASAGSSVAGHADSVRETVDPGCTPQWWPEARQNACGNSSATNAQAPSRASVARLKQAWTYKSGTGTPQPIVWKDPTMQAPLVYLVGGGRLHALDLSTGRLRWTAKAGDGGDPSQAGAGGGEPVAAGDVLLQNNLQGVLRRYVPRSGQIFWERSLEFQGDFFEPPAVADGNVYLSASPALVAYDAGTGEPLWQRPFGCFRCGFAASGGRLYAAGDPVTSPYTPTPPGAVYALDARTGETLWSANTVDADYTSAAPVLAAGRVFVRTITGSVATTGPRTISIEAFNAADGRHLWHASIGTFNGFWFMPVSADASLVVYAAEDNTLYALNAATGALRWKSPGNTNTAKPAIVNGLVWAEDGRGRLIALDARNGHRLWASAQFGLDHLGSPVIAGSFVLIGTTDGRLRAYHVR